MANMTQINTPTDTLKIKDTISQYTTNEGTVTGITKGVGLTASTSSDTKTITLGCDLKSTTKSSLAAASRGSTSGREYCVGLDANGDLSVNVPWSNTTYSEGKNISITSGGNIAVVRRGEVYNTLSSTNVSVPNLTTTILNACEFHTNYGTYLVIAHATWSKNQYGYRRIYFANASDTNSLNRFSWSKVAALQSNTTDTLTQEICFIVNITSSLPTIRLIGYQNSGATLTVIDHEIYAVRLKEA